MAKFKTQYNKNEFKNGYEKGGGLSKTIPDQALTVPQIMERNKRGLTIPMAKQVFHELDENDQGQITPDLAKMDFAEIQELKAQNIAQIEQLRLDMQEYQEQQKAASNPPKTTQEPKQEPVSEPISTKEP